MTRIVVIGGGPAGTFAALAAKKQDPAADVVLLTDEHCEPYEKPPLSKGVLVGKVRPADAPIAGPGGLAAHGVVLECNARVQAIDREARTVLLEDGRRIAYGALVIATGSLVRELPHLPIGMPHVHYLDDHGEIEGLVQDAERPDAVARAELPGPRLERLQDAEAGLALSEPHG